MLRESIDRHVILPTGKRVLIPHGSVVKYPGKTQLSYGKGTAENLEGLRGGMTLYTAAANRSKDDAEQAAYVHLRDLTAGSMLHSQLCLRTLCPKWKHTVTGSKTPGTLNICKIY